MPLFKPGIIYICALFPLVIPLSIEGNRGESSQQNSSSTNDWKTIVPLFLLLPVTLINDFGQTIESAC